MAFIFGNIEARLKYFNEANLITHTFSKSLYEKTLGCYKFGKFSLYYDTMGNLGSASLPVILHEQYNNKIPKGEKLAWLGNAAGGSDYLIEW